MIEVIVFMHIMHKILEGIYRFIIMNQLNVLNGINLHKSAIMNRDSVKIWIIVLYVMDGKNLNIIR
jgi:hypothetical protein